MKSMASRYKALTPSLDAGLAVATNDQTEKVLHEPIVLGPHVLRFLALREREEERRIKQKANAERLQLKAEKKQQWKNYEKKVRALTEDQPLHTLPGIHLRGKEYALDHKIPVSVAYKLGWPAEQAADIGNLQILPTLENFRKNINSYSSLGARYMPIAA